MFKAKTFSIDLITTSSPNGRALLIIEALPKAEAELGEKATHVLVDRTLCVNIDLLDEYGIRVHSCAVDWVSRYTARLAVVAPVVDCRRVSGAPAPIRVQARLL